MEGGWGGGKRLNGLLCMKHTIVSILLFRVLFYCVMGAKISLQEALYSSLLASLETSVVFT